MKSLCKGGEGRENGNENEKAGATECTTGCSYGLTLQNLAPGCWGLACALWNEHAGYTSRANNVASCPLKNETPPLVEAQTQRLVSYGRQMLSTKGRERGNPTAKLMWDHLNYYLFHNRKYTAGLVLRGILRSAAAAVVVVVFFFLARTGLGDVTARLISFVGQSVYEWEPVELHNQSLFPCVLSVSTPPHYRQTAPPVVSPFPHSLRLLLLSAGEQKTTETPMKWWALLIAHLLDFFLDWKHFLCCLSLYAFCTTSSLSYCTNCIVTHS